MGAARVWGKMVILGNHAKCHYLCSNCQVIEEKNQCYNATVGATQVWGSMAILGNHVTTSQIP